MPSPPRILPFPVPKNAASWPPTRPPAGVVATLIAEHRRETRTAQVRGAVTCGAPRRHAPHAPCRSTGRLANGHCRWHQGPQDT